MKKILLALVLFVSFLGQAQILDPVKWTTSVKQISNDEFELVMNAVIEKEWHMYSQYTPDGGALPAVFNYKDQKGNYTLLGKTKEIPYKKVFNDIFEVDEYYFAGTAKFTQKIKVTNTALKTVKVALEYQACKEQCIMQDKVFTFTLPAITVAEVAVEKTKTETETTQGKIEQEKTKIIKEEVEDVKAASNTNLDTVFADEISKDVTEDLEKEIASTPAEVKEVTTDEAEKEAPRSLWSIFIVAFFGGFAALLTPCVFPMIPMTVSFFTKQSGSRKKGIANAVFYGFSIIAIYVILGLLVTGIFGADALNELSTSVAFNVIFFVILVFFAISFLGGFEIVLPNSWANKVDSQANKTGLIAIFFMALALAIVSFSCTGPIVGTLLVEAASSGGIAPVVGMLGFSSAIALPFMLFALFPSWMNSLPKSGGWLNTVKVSLGFLELALAFKFLSNADLVLQAHWLEREVFLVIWIVIFGAWAMYLFGKIQLPHDSPLPFLSVGRLFLALFVSMFTLYLIPGLLGAPLKIISGFPPPMTYSESPYGVGYTNGGNGQATTLTALPEHAHNGPHGIIAFHDYEEGLAYAKKVNKPVLLDFTGHACVNCRKMEEQVWSIEKIKNILKNDMVLISLYVDEKAELPKEEQYVSETTGKEIISVGNKWSDFQITRYKNNAQPYYIILDADGNDLIKPTSYTPNADEYYNWLKEGVAKFK